MKTPDEIKKGLEICSNDTMLCYEKCPYFSSISNGVDCAVEMKADALAYIQQLEAAVPRWISVKDQLPKEREFVLFLYAKDAQKPTLHSRNIMAVGRYEYGMFLVEGCSVKITHWMPLPEPPVEV